MIFVDDHEPAHIHVTGGGNAKITLRGTDGKPELVYNDGFKAGDMRKAMRVVERNQATLLERWSELHGGID